MELKNNSECIFKYMPLNLNAIKLFVNNELWFGKPDIQNDPNEAEFILDYENNIEISYELQFKLTKELKEVILETDSGKNNTTGFEREEFEKCLKEDVRNSIGICSMSEKCDDILMWSHYADSNRGICIVFNKEKLVKSLCVSHARNVDYSEKLAYAKFSNDGEYGVLVSNDLFSAQKFNNWHYENEFRFISRYNNLIKQERLDRLHSFQADCIAGVIIGEKFSENDFETLANLLLNRDDYQNITFWQCEKNIYERKMRIYPIRDSYKGRMDLILNKVKEISKKRRANYAG